jgi:aspartyl-tRNA(Asn)/glutamyl-tRNA(Gln) amidotransferase subunit A
MNELWRLDARQLADGYASGSFTPLQALEACLSRARHCQPELNAFVLFDEEGARAAAQASTLRWSSGRPLSPLDGIPVSVKDNLHVAGLPTGWGSRVMHGTVPAQDEVPVARLRAAGAVLFGKTTLSEFAMQGYTANLATGITRNPWDTALTPGGSSGGAAAAIAAGCGPLALATDGGGSTRRPASHCGLVGLKPSGGWVARGGGLPELSLHFEVVGGIGRTVDDVALLTEVISGKSLDASPVLAARILFVERFGAQLVDPGIAACVRESAHHWALLGHSVTASSTADGVEWIDWATQINGLWSSLPAAGLAVMFDAPGSNLDADLCGPVAKNALAQGRKTGPADMQQVFNSVHQLEQQMDRLFSDYDFILTPATAAMPWPAADTHPPEIAGAPAGPRGHAVFTAFANAVGLPAVALPDGRVNGLPTGFQLVGRKGDDARLVAMARQFEAANPWAASWQAQPLTQAAL